MLGIPDFSYMFDTLRREAEYSEREAALSVRENALNLKEARLNHEIATFASKRPEERNDRTDYERGDPPFKVNCQNQAQQQPRTRHELAEAMTSKATLPPPSFARHPGEMKVREIPAPDYTGASDKMPAHYKPENWGYSVMPPDLEEIKFARPQHRHHNKLTPHEAEKLALIVGACAQVSGQVSEVLRHGWRGDNGNARGRLEVMLGDLMGILRMAESAGIVRGDRVNLMIPHAIEEFSASLHHK